MPMNKAGYSSTDEYIAGFPADVQERLQTVRETIRATAPDAKERISYQMPAFDQNGIVVYFAAVKNGIGLYPTGSGIEAFKDELSEYETTKGSVKFPDSKPLPLDLITRIVQFKVAENMDKAAAKAHKKG